MILRFRKLFPVGVHVCKHCNIFVLLASLCLRVCEGDLWRYGGAPGAFSFGQFLKYCGMYGDDMALWRRYHCGLV